MRAGCVFFEGTLSFVWGGFTETNRKTTLFEGFPNDPFLSNPMRNPSHGPQMVDGFNGTYKYTTSWIAVGPFLLASVK